jgi:DNA-binding IclR family transcriptional regulator
MPSALTPSPGAGGDRAAVKSADRALQLLEFIGDRGAVRFTELLTELGLPRSSAHGLVSTLAARGWIEHDAAARTYSLGPRVWQLGQRYASRQDVAALARPVMDDLAREVGETVQLAELDGVANVYLAISEGPLPMRLASSVDMRLHSHGTGIGKALLSQLSSEEVRRRLSAVALPRFTEHTITDVEQLVAAVDRVRTDGFAVDDEEYLLGCRCVAVPLGRPGRIDAGRHLALSVTAPVFRCGPDWPERPLRALQRAAVRIQAQQELGS